MALVDMFAEDFGFVRAAKRGKRLRYLMVLSFALGGVAMAIIGLWA
jgi:3-oxoacyl-(acyl-carrier-protein) synthase